MPAAIPPPVKVQFNRLYQLDTAVLSEGFVPFGQWSDAHIAESIPVEVSYPAEISKRLKVLEGYLVDGGWPRGVPSGGIEAVRSVVEKMMPQVEVEISQGVRLMAAAAIRDDGSRAAADRDKILTIFLESKMLATARALQGNRLIGEPFPDWGAEFYEMSQVFSPRLIYGLSFIARSPYDWAGWADADFHIRGERYRIFTPICPGPSDSIEIRVMGPDVRQLIIPQLLQSNFSKPSYSVVRSVLFDPWEALSRNLVQRDEVFVDAETYSDHPNAKSYVKRIAADRIASRLLQLPSKDRWEHLLRMTMPLGSLQYEISRLVKERLSLGQ